MKSTEHLWFSNVFKNGSRPGKLKIESDDAKLTQNRWETFMLLFILFLYILETKSQMPRMNFQISSGIQRSEEFFLTAIAAWAYMITDLYLKRVFLLEQ